jgi:DNA repair protein RecO (recombination protein O)
MNRVAHQPAYVLHHYDWSETSVIVEAFTRDYGRLALVANGAKRPSSYFRSVLLPLQPLFIAWGGKGEIRTLKSAEWGGGSVMPTGDALLSGYYVNELLLRMVAREDPHPRLFDAYAATVESLASGGDSALAAAALRAFELVLLRDGGYLPALDSEALTLAPLAARGRYALLAERGLCAAPDAQQPALGSDDWLAFERAFAQDRPLDALAAVVRALAPADRAGLRQQLRQYLDGYSGGAPLRTRQLASELQRFKR